MWKSIVAFFRRILEKMGLVSNSFPVVLTPSGDADLHFPDGNDGTVAIPLTWATIPSFLQKQEGTPFSVNLATLYLTQAGSPNATITAVSGTLSGGWTLSSAGLLEYSGTGHASITLRARATRLTKKSDSNFFTVESIAHIVSADVQAPTIPTGLNVTASGAASRTLACDAPADVPTSLIPADGMKEVRWFDNGVLNGSVSAMSAGLLLRASKADVATASGRKWTPGHYVTWLPGQRTLGRIPNVSHGANYQPGPCAPGIVAGVSRHSWKELEPAGGGVFAFGAITTELADAVTLGVGLVVMIDVRTFATPTDVDFTASVGGASSGTLLGDSITFTASVGGATSGTLNSASNSATADGTYKALFSNGNYRATVTISGASVTWSGALSAGTVTTAHLTQVADGTYGALFSNGESRSNVVLSGFSYTWSPALAAGSVTTAKLLPIAGCPMPTDLRDISQVFAGANGGGWQGWRWHATYLARWQALCNAIGAQFDSHPNFLGIATQETSTGGADNGGYSQPNFEAALKTESDHISNGCPMSRHFFYMNFMNNKLAGETNNTGKAALKRVCSYISQNGAVVGFPDLVMHGTILDRVYPNVQAYHDGTAGTEQTAPGPTFASIQPDEWAEGPVSDSRTVLELFRYATGQIADNNGTKLLKTDIMVVNWQTSTTGADNEKFDPDYVSVAVANPASPTPFGTVTPASSTSMTAGIVTQTGVDYSVKSYGTGIGTTSDQWTAARISANGDFTAIVKLNGVTGADITSAIAGLSVRDGTGNVDARAVHLVNTASRLRSRYRPSPGAVMTDVTTLTGHDLVTAKWLKITRVGNLFSYFYSMDGGPWTAMGTATVTMSTAVYVELFAAAGSASTFVTASFKQTNVQNLAAPTHTFAGMSAGIHLLTAVARDLALNDSAASTAISVTIP